MASFSATFGNARSFPSATAVSPTVAALVAMNRPDQLRFHLGYAVQNGVKKEEFIEVITHLAFYSGLAQRNERHHGCKRGALEGVRAESLAKNFGEECA